MTPNANLHQLLRVEQPLNILVWDLEPANDLLPLEEMALTTGAHSTSKKTESDE